MLLSKTSLEERDESADSSPNSTSMSSWLDSSEEESDSDSTAPMCPHPFTGTCGAESAIYRRQSPGQTPTPTYVCTTFRSETVHPQSAAASFIQHLVDDTLGIFTAVRNETKKRGRSREKTKLHCEDRGPRGSKIDLAGMFPAQPCPWGATSCRACCVQCRWECCGSQGTHPTAQLVLYRAVSTAAGVKSGTGATGTGLVVYHISSWCDPRQQSPKTQQTPHKSSVPAYVSLVGRTWKLPRR